jgi:peptide deformylase
VAIRDIVLYTENETALRKKSKPVRDIDRRIEKLIRDLKDTLIYHSEGIGLAAPQINAHRRVVVIRLGSGNNDQGEPNPPVALINPEIVEAGNEQRDLDGCLSFPGIRAVTIRPHFVRIIGLDEWGNPFEQFCGGNAAAVIHHEIDHLNGLLFIDRVESVEDLFEIREDEMAR